MILQLLQEVRGSNSSGFFVAVMFGVSTKLFTPLKSKQLGKNLLS